MELPPPFPGHRADVPAGRGWEVWAAGGVLLPAGRSRHSLPLGGHLRGAPPRRLTYLLSSHFCQLGIWVHGLMACWSLRPLPTWQ